MRRSEREISELGQIEEIINKADVCRVAFADQNVPYIVTMNFGYKSNRLYFHCAREGRKLEMMRRNNYVCFEMDIDHQLYTGQKACDTGMNYRSVVGYGKISIISDEEERITGMNSILDHYNPQKDYDYDESVFERTVMLKLEITELTGKKC
jgi:uncharacterized protein